MQNVALDCAGGSGGDGCTSDFCVDGDIDRQSEAHPPKSEKGRDDGKV
jgi:hypothetical protein